MKRIFYLLAMLAAMAVSHSCLFHNDMDYPYVKGEIIAFEVEDQTSVSIDQSKRTVAVVLGETADMACVHVKGAELNEGAVFADGMPETLDLTSPVELIVRTWQDYRWTISATQPIILYAECENASFEPMIEENSKRVTVFLLSSQPLTSVVINEMKLGPEGSEIVSTTGSSIIDGQLVESTVDCEFPMALDCTLRRTFKVLYKGQETEWEFVAAHREPGLKIKSANAWCYHADVLAEFSGAGEPEMQYKAVSADEWTDVPEYEMSGVYVSARIDGLEADTEYTVRIGNGSDSDEMLFRTEIPQQLPNMGFDEWYQNGKGTWFPNTDASVEIWDTANGGAALMGKNPTVPENDFLATDEPGNKSAAKLQSMVVGMFAAGNIYTGLFKKAAFTGNIGAILDWGTPFTGRPKSLKGYYSYSPKVIDRVKAPYENLKGTMDKCQILVLLTDWDEPFTVNTSEGIFVDQENDPHIIAYARYESDEDTGGKYKAFELPLEYRRPDATPKYAVVIACASYKGDFFTGGVGSVMYVDEFEFVYE